MDVDLQRAWDLLDGDLFRLTGHYHALQPFIERTRTMLESHWPAVAVLASALIEQRRIEGRRIEGIIGAMLP